MYFWMTSPENYMTGIRDMLSLCNGIYGKKGISEGDRKYAFMRPEIIAIDISAHETKTSGQNDNTCVIVMVERGILVLHKLVQGQGE